MTTEDNTLPEEATDEEMEEFEHSIELASAFLDQLILPLLDKFEESNSDQDYIEGAATHGLFISIIQRMSEMGYTEEDLVNEIKTYTNASAGQVLH